MTEIVEKSIKELLELIGLKPKDVTSELKTLLNAIGKEALAEMQEGMPKASKDGVKTLIDAAEQLDKDSILKITETSAQRILVNYFADNKKKYDERQKEIFLTFLLTNKIQRELEKQFD